MAYKSKLGRKRVYRTLDQVRTSLSGFYTDFKILVYVLNVFKFSFSVARPRYITEELWRPTAQDPMSSKPFSASVHAALRARNAASGARNVGHII